MYMHHVVLILGLFAFIIFFKDEVFSKLYKFDKYPYLVMSLILIILNYLILLNLDNIHQFFGILVFNLQNLKKVIYHLLSHVLNYQQVDFIADWLTRALVFGFCIFYPYYYRKKHPSLVYKIQLYSLNFVYVFLVVFFCMFFARIDL